MKSVPNQSITKYDRQIGYFNPEFYRGKVTVVGCGATGSWAGLALAKSGIAEFGELYLVDGDVIEPHNPPNQLFPASRSNEFKVDVAAELIELLTDSKPVPVNEFVSAESGHKLNGLVVFCTDSLEARKVCFEKAKADGAEFLVDIRVSFQEYDLWTIDMGDSSQRDSYEISLDLKNLDEEACTMKMIVSNVFTAVGATAEIVMRLLRGDEVPLVVNNKMLEGLIIV